METTFYSNGKSWWWGEDIISGWGISDWWIFYLISLPISDTFIASFPAQVILPVICQEFGGMRLR